jgi:Zn-dependent protease with chaperone function/Zn-finger nucleic acid-binding protein
VSTTTGARRTLFDIEREKRWRVWLLFALLVGMVFVAAWVACFIVTFSLFLSFPFVDTFTWIFTLKGIGLILGVALAGSLLYWFGSRVGARRRLLRAMHCQPLDAGDRYHQRLANIVEEMRIATGGPRIDCFTVRTLGLNAFAFSDLHGRGVIGVTEGALARLSRQQLQGVVAHEFGHILSGNYVTVTVSCLLFGIYSEIGDRLEDAALATGSTRAAPFALVAIALRGWLWVLQLASSVANSALSRERECQADLAAARYTRDPLSLAEALRIISRHPGGAGYIPEGLAPLCIRDTQSRIPWLLGSRRATHPPIGERVDALLALANVSPRDFAEQVDTAEETFDEREHWTAAPAAGAAGGRRGVEIAGAILGPAAATLVAAPAGASAGGAMTCPACGDGLTRADYEGVRVFVCSSCGGRLASPSEVSKVLARREVAFTAEQQRLADLLAAGGDQLRRAALLARGRPGVDLIACPRCARTMMRRHYSYEHAVEIDYCSICDIFWFEKDELEALQILVERQAG